MMKNKKAQGLSLTTIIVALLVLLVLVVLALIFSGSMGNWAERLRSMFEGEKECDDLVGGHLVPPGQGCSTDEVPYLGFLKLPEGQKDHICCVEREETT